MKNDKGGPEARNSLEILAKSKTLKVKTQECCRGEIDSTGCKGGLRARSLGTSKRCEWSLVGFGNPIVKGLYFCKHCRERNVQEGCLDVDV